MAIFYFKNIFLVIVLLGLTPIGLMAQTKLVKPPSKTIKKVNTKKTTSKNAISLKLDEQGMAYYTDQQGDKVIVLDYKTRKSMQAISNYNAAGSLSDKLNSKSFYKETAPDFVEEVKPGFKNYISTEGDTWTSISEKLFNTNTQWAQLKLWNEELLTSPKIPAGSKIKYKDLVKK